jgi:GNAT superfamily N-acetyltransferase
LAIEVVAATGKSGLNEFIEVPWSIYRNDTYWVPPLRIAVKELLDRKKHPFYTNAEAEFFLAKSDGRTVGRIAAILDRNHNKFHNEKAGFFGFFESVDDPAVARALVNTARDWVTKRGAGFLRGPVNPSTNYECGLLVENFEASPMVMTYNPRYYPALLEKAGLVKEKDLYAYVNTADGVALERIGRVATRALTRNGVTIRPVNMKDFAGEVARIWDIYNSAWSRNWGFVPMTREEFFLMGKEMKQILKPEMVLIGEAKGRMIGFALALPDANFALKPANGKLLPTGLLKILYYQRLIRSVRVIALGVVEEFRASGVAAGFYAELVRNARKLGFNQECEMSWILEDNVLMNRSLELMGAKRSRTYRIYQMDFDASNPKPELTV